MSELRIPTLNRVLLSGRLTRDPELKYTAGGVAVCNFSLAVNRKYKDQGGQWRDEATFINVVTWHKAAETVNKFLRKGSPVIIEGRLESRSWETDAGQKRTAIEVRADQVRFLEKSESAPDATAPDEPAA